MKKRLNRRDFLKKTGTAGLGMALGSMAMSKYGCVRQPQLKTTPIEHLAAQPIETVRVV